MPKKTGNVIEMKIVGSNSCSEGSEKKRTRNSNGLIAFGLSSTDGGCSFVATFSTTVLPAVASATAFSSFPKFLDGTQPSTVTAKSLAANRDGSCALRECSSSALIESANRAACFLFNAAIFSPACSRSRSALACNARASANSLLKDALACGMPSAPVVCASSMGFACASLAFGKAYRKYSPACWAWNGTLAFANAASTSFAVLRGLA